MKRKTMDRVDHDRNTSRPRGNPTNKSCLGCVRMDNTVRVFPEIPIKTHKPNHVPPRPDRAPNAVQGDDLDSCLGAFPLDSRISAEDSSIPAATLRQHRETVNDLPTTAQFGITDNVQNPNTRNNFIRCFVDSRTVKHKVRTHYVYTRFR
jgi:hypothetical protein